MARFLFISIYHRVRLSSLSTFVLWLFMLSVLIGCGEGDSNSTSQQSSSKRQRTAVTLTKVGHGCIDSEIEFTATTAYLTKILVTSPIAAYVRETRIRQGQRVAVGETLFVLENKDQHFIGQAPLLVVKAMQSGVVLDTPVQAGNFVADTGTLCTVANTGSLVFELNVPSEQQTVVHTGSHCTIELPDGRQFSATVTQPLVAMNTVSQSVQVVARADHAPFLPEGLNAAARFVTKSDAKTKTLPRSAVQSDETLTMHWVMRLVNDSTVEQVMVKVGRSNADSIEIYSDSLSDNDRIVLTGGYGLTDGAAVAIERTK